jgi:hypothetical protein
MDLLGSLREVALEAGAFRPRASSLVEGVIAKQLDSCRRSATAENGSRDELFKEWGGAKGRQDGRRPECDARARPQARSTSPRCSAASPCNMASRARSARSSCCRSSAPASPRTRCSAATGRAGSASPARGAKGDRQADRRQGVRREAGEQGSGRGGAWDRLNAAVAADRERKERRARRRLTGAVAALAPAARYFFGRVLTALPFFVSREVPPGGARFHSSPGRELSAAQAWNGRGPGVDAPADRGR